MAALTRLVGLVALAASCVSKPALPPDHGVARSWHERTDHPGPNDVQPGMLQVPRLVYDPRRQRVLLYGGHQLGAPATDSMFELDPESGWKLVCTTCLEQASPIGAGGRASPALVYDPLGDRVLLFGGDHFVTDVFNDLWALSGDTWSLVPTTGTAIPTPRTFDQMVFDPTQQKLWLLGGYAMSNPRSDSYFLDAQNTWSKAPIPNMDVVISSPGVDSVYDPQRDRVLLLENANVPSSELWQYAANEWQLVAAHASATDRQEAVMVHLPDYDQTFLIGGFRDMDDTDLIAGTEVLVGDHFETFDASLPPARSAPGIAYDASRDVVVMYGGHGLPDGTTAPDCNGNHDCQGTWELRRD
jgi:hypothetical protein